MTNKQTMFISEYLKDFNATQAAIRAGYSEDSAYQIGHENLRKHEIRKAIQEYIDQTLENDRMTLKREVIDKLKEIAFGEGEIRYDKDGNITSISQTNNVRASELLGKYMSMFVDKSEHTVKTENKLLVVNTEKLSEEDATKLFYDHISGEDS